MSQCRAPNTRKPRGYTGFRVSRMFLANQGVITTAQPALNASTSGHERRRSDANSATTPNGSTAEIRAVYLHAIAPPANRPASPQRRIRWSFGADHARAAT